MRIALIASAVLMLCSSPCAAQRVPTAQPSLTVHGQGRVEVPPDYASITVEVETKAKTTADAAAAHRERATRASHALRDMSNDGVNIVRSSFRLAELRSPPSPSNPSRSPDSEFQAITSFELKITRIDAVNDVVTKIASTGLFQVRNLRFGVNEDNPGADAARKRAVANTREHATTYAEAAGVRLGEILKIEDLENPGPVLFSAQPQPARSVQVIPPEGLMVTASVVITWSIVAKPNL
jgi:uncharacterized protein YggE